MTQSRAVHNATRGAVDPPARPAASSWAEALADHWRERLGDVAEADEIIGLLSSSLAPGTAESYGRHFARFIRWCAVQPDAPSPLPASTATVVRWLAADVVKEDRVAARSLQPYLSALNRVHRDLELPEPALGHLVQQVRRAVALRQAASRTARRVYLPPEAVGKMLTALTASCQPPSPPGLLRAVTAVVLTFCLFARGGTGAALRARDVRRGVAGITVTLDQEKGKRVEGTARSITFPPGSIPGLDELLARWERVRGSASGGRSYFSFPHERASWPASQIDAWLQACLAHFGFEPPAGEVWSGHSLRKGAASGANALDVSLQRICYVGGWSIKSRAVHDYIDHTCPLTPACRRFFGWLKPA